MLSFRAHRIPQNVNAYSDEHRSFTDVQSPQKRCLNFRIENNKYVPDKPLLMINNQLKQIINYDVVEIKTFVDEKNTQEINIIRADK